MNISLLLLIAITQITICLSANEAQQSTNSYLTVADKAHFKKILEPGLKSNDVSLVYYAVYGYKLLGETLPNQKDICDSLMKVAKDETNLNTEKAFFIASTWKAIGSCPNNPNIAKVLLSVVDKDGSSMLELYYAVNGLTALSQKLPREKIDKVVKAMQSMLRKDDNLWNLGYTFHIASDLGASGVVAWDRIEDAIVQADEVDGQYLQFEGGLSVTSFLVNGILKLSNTLKTKPPLTTVQTVKMANYLLSRRSVQTPKGVTNLLSALTTMANSDIEKPACITLANEGIGISAQQPLVTVKVCDILGNSLTSVSKVIANSATRVGDDSVVLSKQSLQASPTDKTLYTLNLMETKPERGFYKISITAGTVTNTVTVKVLCQVMVDYLEIGTGDADQTTQPKLSRVTYPEKLTNKIEADSQQKLVMRFLLKDGATKKNMRTHQAFVRLSSASTSNDGKKGHEILFVAEPDASHVYKFDMPVGSAAGNFDHQSGDYNVELIVGDAILNNPFQWKLATVTLKFPEPTSAERIDKSNSHRPKLDVYSTKPEIKHMFREPEKRPPAFVSNLFTGLCLAPVLLLLILWAKLGANISNFPLSVSAFTFHTGLGSIFVLFGIFWLKLNMFVTLRYLLSLGVVTFLAGNKLLSHIAHKHKSR
ncbi:dolichyl-diphosphooligosaccharide--protein glycosyltransferase subunit 2 [Hylaeus anthracinus]|uniref:dolichyl-diphosphooligosaccharide--protein glycosyltransferase subunit 2 n=1 Tax=Hylaeus volcanicus TaxID=313075 RepID=UPI0023B837A5|nr:dolichyl-diphosphooligosaccharide--protein glycosyltransferase subunit 2 [Hylaeus volcanicus]XP_054014001.1 dolichyl-diphosphooligosaccharide--protein glycosyltransferase subunit 2 [Hylaeus anthracinus]